MCRRRRYARTFAATASEGRPSSLVGGPSRDAYGPRFIGAAASPSVDGGSMVTHPPIAVDPTPAESVMVSVRLIPIVRTLYGILQAHPGTPSSALERRRLGWTRFSSTACCALLGLEGRGFIGPVQASRWFRQSRPPSPIGRASLPRGARRVRPPSRKRAFRDRGRGRSPGKEWRSSLSRKGTGSRRANS